jgi:hypothetical protein
MGCGTGSFGSTSKLEMKLRLNNKISAGDPVYTHFKEAVEFLLPGQVHVSDGQLSGGLVIEPIVTVMGPLENDTAFNRAFNRLMWGLQRRRPGTTSSGYEISVIDRTLDNQKKNDEPWKDEWT